MDAQGRLYGTTTYGGVYGKGIVFRLTAPVSGKGTWSEDILHAFTGGADGGNPSSPVTFGPDGTLYGTTGAGGAQRLGTVFKLQNSPNGALKALHSFTYADGGFPTAGLTFGSDGLLYGTTSAVSLNSYRDTGTDFSISPLGDTVEYRVLHAFGKPRDGFAPTGLTAAPASVGGFLGTTELGPDSVVAQGNVYSLKIYPDGEAREQPLYSFGQAPDVGEPIDPPVLGTDRLRQSAYGCGTAGGSQASEASINSVPTVRAALAKA
jgi:uncharacterized repeat protein (TIGR03803 family)